jgi:hypothetical protein
MKKTVKEIKEMYPEDELRRTFLEREDIACLPVEEQEARWEKQKIAVKNFMKFLSTVEYAGEIKD